MAWAEVADHGEVERAAARVAERAEETEAAARVVAARVVAARAAVREAARAEAERAAALARARAARAVGWKVAPRVAAGTGVGGWEEALGMAEAVARVAATVLAAEAVATPTHS
jgi:hypothetical protein